jgi:hypothetical protein
VAVVLALIWAGSVSASPENVMITGISMAELSPLLINFDCPDETAVKFRVYYRTPLDPDTWIWYRSRDYEWWELVNEIGSPHHYTINIKYCPPAFIGVIDVAVASVDEAGNESEKVIASWSG